ncbi:FAD-dependent oxidoreductase [Natrinema limicola]|uniref:Oxidoreductase n=1 Tax=Natrinema limicola JCM 13563 TaxID=1230457 RepID=M0CRR8_9EURY|nr:FAD-dependent monooxygenase [Natrinema limicola]ELZ25353.1 oxidoreductase [Natrinema limicola JCM 13563]
MTLANIARYDERRAPSLGQRAVVVGGSVAGLCAARVLCDSFVEIVVLERDAFPSTPAAREGAPQTSQPHALLEAGRTTLEDFFPGFGNAVQSAGGLQLDMTKDFVWYDQGGAVTEAAADLPALYASRPLFEHVIRERLREFSEVQLRGGCHVLGYEHDAETERMTGVRFRDEDGQETTLEATLVVDATGRQSRTPTWLETHGYPVPDVDTVEIDVTYSTVRIERPPDVRGGVLIAPEPHRPRGAAMLPIEDGQWEVLLQGLHGEQAPADRETFIEWAEALPRDEIGRRLREQEWVSESTRYPFPASVRRYYSSLDRFPKGLVVTGDAIASFNPIYGQGMSVAALDALALHHELAAGLAGLGPRFFRRTDAIIDEAWRIAVGKDFVFDRTTGPKPFGTDLFNKYVARLLRRAHDDGTLTEAFFHVFRLERSATSLLHPSVVWRVFRPRFGSATSSSENESTSYSTGD